MAWWLLVTGFKDILPGNFITNTVRARRTENRRIERTA